MALAPTADEISVREVLAKFESQFTAVAQAVENGEFALWVGSGISRQAPNLGELLERAIDFIRERAVDPATASTFLPALEEALELAEVEPGSVRLRYEDPLASWPERNAIINKLWNNYSRVLDIRIAGTDSDFVLWEAIDIRQAFAQPEPPAAEHLCIAILILEGAVQNIASANWDGFIEAAVNRLSNGVPGVLQVVVDPNQLRGPAGRARLLKFHGCIVHATSEPDVFRRFLTGSSTQIVGWPENPAFAAVSNEIVGLATRNKTFVLGLSIQDSNLQTIFTRARFANSWPWPCDPAAPAFVFCENTIKEGQRAVLRLAYDNLYNNNSADIHEATLLRAWGEKVLIALVLKVIWDKLQRLMELDFTALGKQPMAGALQNSLRALRGDIADFATPSTSSTDRTDVVNQAIAFWSRLVSLFRCGALPANSDAYETLSNLTPNLITTDPNAQAMGLGRLGVAVSLLQHGRAIGLWDIRKPVSEDLTSGAMAARASRPNGEDRPIFLVKSVAEMITLKRNGAFANNNAIIIHGDDTWHTTEGRSSSARRRRKAPGRTGHIDEMHISLGNLLSRSTDAAALQTEFVFEMML